MDVTCGWSRGFQAYRSPNGCDVTVFRGPAKSLTLAEFMAVSDSHRWHGIGRDQAPELQRARFATAFHRACLRDLLDLADVELADEPATADMSAPDEVRAFPPPPVVDVKVLVAAPSAPPLLFAPISTLEANTA